MELPPAVDVDLDLIRDRHDLGSEDAHQLTQVGIFNTVYALGDGRVRARAG